MAAEFILSETITVQDCDESLPATGTVCKPADFTYSPVLSSSKEIDSPIPILPNQEAPLIPEQVMTTSPLRISEIRAILNNVIKLPKKTPTIKLRKGRDKQHGTVLTSTSMKENLIEKENKKLKKQANRKRKQKRSPKVKSQGKKTKIYKKDNKKAKRRVVEESKETSVSDCNTKDQEDELNDKEDAGNKCIVCSNFGRNNVMWYRCTACGLWAHAECSAWDLAESTFETYVKFSLTPIAHRMITITLTSGQ